LALPVFRQEAFALKHRKKMGLSTVPGREVEVLYCEPLNLNNTNRYSTALLSKTSDTFPQVFCKHRKLVLEGHTHVQASFLQETSLIESNSGQATPCRTVTGKKNVSSWQRELN
jgi:hypothetical protein